jgi:hypothetical protein
MLRSFIGAANAFLIFWIQKVCRATSCGDLGFWVSGARLYLAIIPKRDLKEVEFLKDSSYARESEGTDVLVVPRK